MKQKFENLGSILSRDAQKKLVGGENPFDVGGDGFDNGWKCCWTGTSNCSECAAYGSCVTGATQTKC
ncbi:MAG: hypothetical protein Q8K64_00950 [Sediminibacterium sp.]|nr:hypothetical protein [Sediminibacterium sp.]